MRPSKQRLWLFEFVSTRSVHQNLDLDIMSEAFVKGFSAYREMWIILDRYSSSDAFILDWVRLFLEAVMHMMDGRLCD